VAWVRASVADVRAQPSHAAEQVTQALQGEMCLPLAHQDGWLHVSLADGYQGWIRDWHLVPAALTEITAFRQQANGRVQVPWATVRSAPEHAVPPVAETLLGTPVHSQQPTTSGWLEVALPTGLSGWLPESAVRAGDQDWPLKLSSILAMYESFLGVPYVWGGRSPKGFDCSGLVQFVLGLHGIALQRDSKDQYASTVRTADPQPGDLLFFGASKVSHVAVQFDAQRYLHARGAVRFNSRNPEHPLYDAALARQYRGASRVLPQPPRPDGVS
jgi:cell wall-associated NlpC family hydrolase